MIAGGCHVHAVYANTLTVGKFLVAIAKAVNKVKISGVARVLRHAAARRRGGWASSYLTTQLGTNARGGNPHFHFGITSKLRDTSRHRKKVHSL